MTEPDLKTEGLYSHPGMKLARHAGIHLLLWLALFSLFGAAESWYILTGLSIAALLCVPLGILAGLATTTLIHEWFHLLGAWLSGARYTIPAKTGLFVFDWDFKHNSLRQFYCMSIAGNVGGALSVIWLWNVLPADTAGRSALLAAALASLIFAAAIEWPVIKRCRRSGNPMAELSLIDQRVLLTSLLIALTGAGLGFLSIY